MLHVSAGLWARSLPEHRTGPDPHLFSLSPQNLTYEIILTLGQAFEVAYQLALQAQKTKQHQNLPSSDLIETKSSRPVPKPRGSVRKSGVSWTERYLLKPVFFCSISASGFTWLPAWWSKFLCQPKAFWLTLMFAWLTELNHYNNDSIKCKKCSLQSYVTELGAPHRSHILELRFL